MGHIVEEVVAVSLSSPKVEAVLLQLVRLVLVKVQAKPQNDHFAQLELKTSSRQKHLVVRDVSPVSYTHLTLPTILLV